MIASKLNWFWTLITIFLVVIIVAGGIVTGLRYRPGRPIEISIPQGQELQGRIYIGGNVTNPGFYSFTTRDSLEDLIQAAGGTTDSVNLDELKLYFPESGAKQAPQKININRAEVWLLEVLPGIAETLAQRIVDYRQQNGPFHNTNELTRVAGVGTAKYEQIKDLITVAD